MQQTVLTLTLAAVAAVVAGGAPLAPRPAAAQPAQPGPQPGTQPGLGGRYQVAAAPGGAGAAPVVVMVDTATGQSWVLVQTPGPPVQWAPVRFWTPGTPPALVPLPPTPEALGRR